MMMVVTPFDQDEKTSKDYYFDSYSHFGIHEVGEFRMNLIIYYPLSTINKFNQSSLFLCIDIISICNVFIIYYLYRKILWVYTGDAKR